MILASGSGTDQQSIFYHPDCWKISSVLGCNQYFPRFFWLFTFLLG